MKNTSKTLLAILDVRASRCTEYESSCNDYPGYSESTETIWKVEWNGKDATHLFETNESLQREVSEASDKAGSIKTEAELKLEVKKKWKSWFWGKVNIKKYLNPDDLANLEGE